MTSLSVIMKGEDGSRALTSAMRALQERIRSLEVDNESLMRALSAGKDRAAQEETGAKARLRDLAKAAAETENVLKARITALEEELKSAQAKAKEAAEQVKIAEGHIRVKQLEALRASELLKFDQESWSLETTNLTRKLQEASSNMQILTKRIAALEGREHSLVEQLAATEQGRKDAWDQATALRSVQSKEATAAKKQLTALEAKLTSQCADLQRQVQSLETQNGKLQTVSTQRLDEANKLRKELRSVRRTASPVGSVSKQKRSKASRPPSGTTTERSNSSVNARDSDSDLLRRITQVEAELEAEDSLYHDLLLQSQDSRADLNSLRSQLDTVADHMETCSAELLQLKKQQVEVARSRLGSASR